jgi:hypothetical protein
MGTSALNGSCFSDIGHSLTRLLLGGSNVHATRLRKPWTRSAFIGHMRPTGLGVVASDAFTAGIEPMEAVRVCLGGLITRTQMRSALDYMAHALEEAPEYASSVL